MVVLLTYHPLLMIQIGLYSVQLNTSLMRTVRKSMLMNSLIEVRRKLHKSEEKCQRRNSVVFLIGHVAFVIAVSKSLIEPTTEMNHCSLFMQVEIVIARGLNFQKVQKMTPLRRCCWLPARLVLTKLRAITNRKVVN